MIEPDKQSPETGQVELSEEQLAKVEGGESKPICYLAYKLDRSPEGGSITSRDSD